jgi:hypothetical protein
LNPEPQDVYFKKVEQNNVYFKKVEQNNVYFKKVEQNRLNFAPLFKSGIEVLRDIQFRQPGKKILNKN